jgi:hypothetical protein
MTRLEVNRKEIEHIRVAIRAGLIEGGKEPSVLRRLAGPVQEARGEQPLLRIGAAEFFRTLIKSA